MRTAFWLAGAMALALAQPAAAGDTINASYVDGGGHAIQPGVQNCWMSICRVSS